MMNKKELREKYRTIRNQMSRTQVKANSIKIMDTLTQTEFFSKSQELFIYVSMNHEVNTLDIIKYAFKKNKRVAVPKVINKTTMCFFYIDNLQVLSRGTFDVLEPPTQSPAVLTKKALMVMPGLVFDTTRNRIGYGGGFYDRYLEKKTSDKIALAFDFQVLSEIIPTSNKDVKPDTIITESQMIT